MKTNTNSTRGELMKQKNGLLTAQRGHRLLKDKLDELMRRFLSLAKETKELRAKAEEGLFKATDSFFAASCELSEEAVSVSLLQKDKTARLSVEKESQIGIMLPVFNAKAEPSFPYGFAFTSSSLDDAMAALFEVSNLLIELAEKEKAVTLTAVELERTRRRVNALEYVVIPDYIEAIKNIKMKLEEQERGNIIRLIKVKDMVLEQKHSPK